MYIGDVSFSLSWIIPRKSVDYHPFCLGNKKCEEYWEKDCNKKEPLKNDMEENDCNKKWAGFANQTKE